MSVRVRSPEKPPIHTKYIIIISHGQGTPAVSANCSNVAFPNRDNAASPNGSNAASPKRSNAASPNRSNARGLAYESNALS